MTKGKKQRSPGQCQRLPWGLARYASDGLRDILGGRYRSGAHPGAVLRTLLSIPPWREFGTAVLFASEREAACGLVEGFLETYQREEQIP